MCVISYDCEVKITGKNHIDGNEEINVVTIQLEQIPDFLLTHSGWDKQISIKSILL